MVHEKFYQYKMSPTDNIAQHISKVDNLAKQLKENGEKISDTAIMTKILSTLPSKYRSLRQAWLSLDPHSQTIQNLTARLLDEEASLTIEEESESALVAVKHTKRKHKFQNENKSSISNQHNKHRFVCYNCNKRGHFTRDCRAPKKSERFSYKEQKMLAFSAQQCLQSEADTDVWILDSGASAHMSYRHDYFCDLQEYRPNNGDRTVRLENKKEPVVKAHGNVLINRYVNGMWEQSIIEDVLFVPDLHRNLFSEVYVMEQENESADVSVVTLRDLAKRRAELVRKKQLILDKLNNTNLHITQILTEPSPATQLSCFPNVSTSENVHDSIAYCETLTTVFELSPGPSASSIMISNIPEALDFSSDDVNNDPDYVPLSEITNLQPIATPSESVSNENVEWYVEREIEPEVAKESRTRKSKADRSSWAVSINKKNRMLGKEYIGLKKLTTLFRNKKDLKEQ
ncbi:unnamed protein product [Euphydryas editha]|uniref:CCHC-type domain-containing protein n=1 Tax=Euphydryas editha TaxID=104508 RepID=A0AAU9UTJ1_EUPED|nr:unnamed protein product [Euphydryas editha]